MMSFTLPRGANATATGREYIRVGDVPSRPVCPACPVGTHKLDQPASCFVEAIFFFFIIINKISISMGKVSKEVFNAHRGR